MDGCRIQRKNKNHARNSLRPGGGYPRDYAAESGQGDIGCAAKQAAQGSKRGWSSDQIGTRTIQQPVRATKQREGAVANAGVHQRDTGNESRGDTRDVPSDQWIRRIRVHTRRSREETVKDKESYRQDDRDVSGVVGQHPRTYTGRYRDMKTEEQGANVLNLRALGFPTPSGRTKEFGPQSGELFRERHLLEAVQKGGIVIININETTGGTSSFFDESVGWLIRKGVLTQQGARERIRIETDEADLEFVERLLQLVIDDA